MLNRNAYVTLVLLFPFSVPIAVNRLHLVFTCLCHLDFHSQHSRQTTSTTTYSPPLRTLSSSTDNINDDLRPSTHNTDALDRHQQSTALDADHWCPPYYEGQGIICHSLAGGKQVVSCATSFHIISISWLHLTRSATCWIIKVLFVTIRHSLLCSRI